MSKPCACSGYCLIQSQFYFCILKKYNKGKKAVDKSVFFHRLPKCLKLCESKTKSKNHKTTMQKHTNCAI